MRVITIAGVALFVAAGAYAQGEPARKAAVEVAARVPLEKAITGAPYSAETVVEGIQTLADGNRINRKTVGRVYRDSEGRTRREEDREGSAMSSDGVVSFKRTTIAIVDPVEGFSYSLDAGNKIAWRTPIAAASVIMGKLEASAVEKRKVEERMLEQKVRNPDEDARAAAAAVEQDKVRAAAVAAAAGGGRGRGTLARVGPGGVTGAAMAPAGPIEHKTLEGVAVEGRKTTTVIPAGQIGNEQPITIVSEEWRSPELNVLVLTRYNDPRTGESTYRLQNIIRAEPDRSLFMVPPDYTVKDTGIRRMLEAARKK